jgi:ATP-dependent DNA ligase
MVRSLEEWRRGETTALPAWVKPQLTKLVDEPPEGPEWLHEIKSDGCRMHARLDRGAVRLLTRTGLDWTYKYPASLRQYRHSRPGRLILTGSCAAGPTA